MGRLSDALNPNRNVSYTAERLFGLGAGIALTSWWLNDPEGNRATLEAVTFFIGLAVMLASQIASIVIKRKQVGTAKAENLKVLKK